MTTKMLLTSNNIVTMIIFTLYRVLHHGEEEVIRIVPSFRKTEAYHLEVALLEAM